MLEISTLCLSRQLALQQTGLNQLGPVLNTAIDGDRISVLCVQKLGYLKTQRESKGPKTSQVLKNFLGSHDSAVLFVVKKDL